ncbi:hypothetical protein CHU95_13090 [Niveispirillum lacus]|uniref:DUF1800 domain-containing protein n=1 Tax=Niveispirillum lacus TaxID=1981099 RepID=A0A255YY58_9PROT|nr:DUF1800 domain-containing protein [Niveispirillum lacus]OYQ33360.1 hypothetical protein CHU95_13090 [Niveispirillum lacus]
MVISAATGTQAAHALSRFGFGAGPGDLDQIKSDPQGWALDQLTPRALPTELANHSGSAPRIFDMLVARKAKGEAEERAKKQARERYRTDIVLRTRLAASSVVPFQERLVQFWSNHFTVSTQRPVIAPLGLAYETEAIRPHILGTFRDMARAAILHPAMLIYLDNAQSIGPDSKTGQKRDRGLNENLGREALELHLLGVDGGYHQDDVRAMALILTGWTLDEERGTASFNPRRHQPGEKVLLGQRIPESGISEAAAAIDLLCAYPTTATHVARKLARHFIADDPPPAAVATLAKSFRDSHGDLAEVTRALVRMDATWAQPLAKMRSPNDFITATLRATALDVPDDRLVNAMRLLGQMPFAAPSPAGWPDRAADWTGPDAILRRIDWSLAFGQRVGATLDVRRFIDTSLGDLADDGLRQAVARAPSPAEALGLVLSSPAFQRR